MSKLRKRDDADRDTERERPGAALVMTCESSTKLRSPSAPISRDVEVEVCASASNNVLNAFHERDCASATMKPSKRLPDTHKGKLVEGASNQREATQSRRVTELAVT